MDKKSQIILKSQSTVSDIDQRLRHAREFIDTSYHLPLDLNQISQQAFFSPYHFLRLFRKTFHQTPHEYLTARRIEKAKQLLVASDLSVTEICFEVGFESLGSFSALFHKYVGHPPKLYRTRTLGRLQLAVLWPTVPIPACYLFRFGPQKSMPTL
jgi:AraC-like DNA-binding protein